MIYAVLAELAIIAVLAIVGLFLTPVLFILLDKWETYLHMKFP